jgi:hypothetical protein
MRDIAAMIRKMEGAGLLTEATRRRFMALSGGMAAMPLAGYTESELPERELVDEDEEEIEGPFGLAYAIPSFLEPEGTPVYEDTLRFRDYSNVKNGIFMTGALSRSSEMGHESYRPELSEEYMPRAGDLFVETFETLLAAFFAEGRISSTVAAVEEGWQATGEIDLADYANASYTYRTHSRAERWLDEGHNALAHAILYLPASYMAAIGEYVFKNHYEDGRFFHDEACTQFDMESMSYGLGATIGTAYAWIRWHSPDGEEDMANLDHDLLYAFLGYDEDDLVELASETAAALDDDWDTEKEIYDFDSSTEYDLVALGSLLRGHKWLYEVLSIFGDDRTTARTLADRTATMLDALVESDVRTEWGLPTKVEYTEAGVEPVSDTVDVADQWQFINHVTGGWTVTRERDSELSPELLNENHDIIDEFDVFAEELLADALSHQFDDESYLISQLDYATGEIIDERYSAAAIGMFLTAAGNAYRVELFERADSWDEVEEAIETRSRELYDRLLANSALLEEEFLRD